MADLTRRTFIGACASVVACAGIGGGVRVLGSSDELLRPPGAQDEAHLLSTCVRCDRCRSVCPTGVIAVGHVEDGLVNARTPILDFHKGYCDFCDKCAEVCMTGAIRPFDETREKIGVAVVIEDRCVAYYGGCDRCAEVCPYEAISLDGAGHPQVNADACNGCGLCVDECPALVYRSFVGGVHRGIEVMSPAVYDRLSRTTVSTESELM